MATSTLHPSLVIIPFDSMTISTLKSVPPEHVGASLIVERVEKETDVIIAEDFITLRDGRAHFFGFVVTMKSQVKRLRIVADHGLSRFRRRNVIARLRLVEIPQHSRLLPNLVV